MYAFRALKRYAQNIKLINVEDLITNANTPPITLIAPAYNEELTCVETVKSLLSLKYPDYEIIVVNDGSKDTTLACLIEAFDLIPGARLPTANIPTAQVRNVYSSKSHSNIWVIDKENGGKADATNTAINYCRTPLLCVMDADCILEREALIRIVRPFLEDSTTIATGGIIRIVNGCTIKSGIVTDVDLPENILARFQVLEYLRAFLAWRMGLDALKAIFIISGAFGLFKRSMVVAVGGYATDTLGEDMELIVRLHRYCRENRIPYRISYVPDPVAWTECPESLKMLGRQRTRWQWGLIDSIIRHQRMLLNPRYGRIGFLAYPYHYFLEMLGPVIELCGYFIFTISLLQGRLSGPYVIAFIMVAFVFGITLSIAAVGLEELSLKRYQRFSHLLQLFLLAVVENFGYRQINAFWRFYATISFFFGVKGSWKEMERKGFDSK